MTTLIDERELAIQRAKNNQAWEYSVSIKEVFDDLITREVLTSNQASHSLAMIHSKLGWL